MVTFSCRTIQAKFLSGHKSSGFGGPESRTVAELRSSSCHAASLSKDGDILSVRVQYELRRMADMNRRMIVAFAEEWRGWQLPSWVAATTQSRAAATNLAINDLALEPAQPNLMAERTCSTCSLMGEGAQSDVDAQPSETTHYNAVMAFTQRITEWQYIVTHRRASVAHSYTSQPIRVFRKVPATLSQNALHDQCGQWKLRRGEPTFDPAGLAFCRGQFVPRRVTLMHVATIGKGAALTGDHSRDAVASFLLFLVSTVGPRNTGEQYDRRTEKAKGTGRSGGTSGRARPPFVSEIG
ncbi:hypothetical protein EDB84DRAFT_1633969 [Lactarius hengduanensis]|nr:hypothetical protein EDB84DRAFT_1633969 [Lactarius hengduanensis]